MPEVGSNELVGKRLPVKELLQKGASVVGALAVSCQDDGAPFVPLGQIRFKRLAQISVSHRGRLVAQAVAQREDANVGLTVPWREHPASVGKRRGLVLDRPRIHLFVHGLIKDVCVPLGPFHVHRWMKKEHIRVELGCRIETASAFGARSLSFLNGWHAQWTKLSYWGAGGSGSIRDGQSWVHGSSGNSGTSVWLKEGWMAQETRDTVVTKRTVNDRKKVGKRESMN